MAPIDKKIVVVDTDITQLFNNKMFIPEEAVKVSHTILPICFLHQKALEQGIELVTPDVFLAMAGPPRGALIMSHLTTPYTKKLVAAGARPFILTCQESPFVAGRFYAGLRRISSPFAHSFVFAGMKKHLSKKTQYHPMYFPVVGRSLPLNPLSFSQKKFLILAGSAKGIRDWRKTILLKTMYGWQVREINSERRKAVAAFSQMEGFDLFGFGWENDKFLLPSVVRRCYRGPLPYGEKVAKFGQYKFSLCFENSIFPGYVTEKIFDSLIAGCVPVYLGAPDITTLVPKGVFIDMRGFKNFRELNSFLTSLPEPRYLEYQENIKKFIDSPGYLKFSEAYFSSQVIDILRQEFALN